MAHLITKDCVSCGACPEQCPTGSIVNAAPVFLIDADTCTDCEACVPVCPTDAIKRLRLAP